MTMRIPYQKRLEPNVRLQSFALSRTHPSAAKLRLNPHCSFVRGLPASCLRASDDAGVCKLLSRHSGMGHACVKELYVFEGSEPHLKFNLCEQSSHAVLFHILDRQDPERNSHMSVWQQNGT